MDSFGYMFCPFSNYTEQETTTHQNFSYKFTTWRIKENIDISPYPKKQPKFQFRSIRSEMTNVDEVTFSC